MRRVYGFWQSCLCCGLSGPKKYQSHCSSRVTTVQHTAWLKRLHLYTDRAAIGQVLLSLWAWALRCSFPSQINSASDHDLLSLGLD